MSEFKNFLVSYRHAGKQWNVEIPAESYEDARARIGQLALGRVEGEVVARIPGALGPVAAIAAFTRNALARLGA